MIPLNAMMTILTPPGAPPRDAVVLRGYLSRPEIAKVLDDLKAASNAAPADQKQAVDDTIDAITSALNLGPDPARLYLSARFDCYVDFDWTDDGLFAVPPDGRAQATRDFSTTVWLRTEQERGAPYVVVRRARLQPEEDFVRGKLVEDFMADPESQTVWDEQTYAPAVGKRSTMFCT